MLYQLESYEEIFHAKQTLVAETEIENENHKHRRNGTNSLIVAYSFRTSTEYCWWRSWRNGVPYPNVESQLRTSSECESLYAACIFPVILFPRHGIRLSGNSFVDNVLSEIFVPPVDIPPLHGVRKWTSVYSVAYCQVNAVEFIPFHSNFWMVFEFQRNAPLLATELQYDNVMKQCPSEIRKNLN